MCLGPSNKPNLQQILFTSNSSVRFQKIISQDGDQSEPGDLSTHSSDEAMLGLCNLSGSLYIMPVLVWLWRCFENFIPELHQEGNVVLLGFTYGEMMLSTLKVSYTHMHIMHIYIYIFFIYVDIIRNMLSDQASILCCVLAGVPVTAAPLVLGLDNKPVERIYCNLETARARRVSMKEKIAYGAVNEWPDVEVDVVDLGK